MDLSILAGCSNGNQFARLIIYDELEEAHARWGPEAPFSYVDDLAQLVVGDKKHVQQILVSSAEFI
eukprot:4405754-Lingulodinium_polyedra.AAC.1